MEQYRYYKREWLNEPGHESTAFIYATIDKNYLDGDISIGDCSRQVHLSFYSGRDSDGYPNEPEYRNCLRKLDTLIETLQEFREAYEKAYHEEKEKSDE